MAYYDIVTTVRIEAEDVQTLFLTAVARAVAEGMDQKSACDLLTNSDPQGRPDINSCLIMLFDPGVSPDGLEIIQTEAARQDMDQDEDMDAYEESLSEED